MIFTKENLHQLHVKNASPIDKQKPCGKQRNCLQNKYGLVAQKVNAQENGQLKIILILFFYFFNFKYYLLFNFFTIEIKFEYVQ